MSYSGGGRDFDADPRITSPEEFLATLEMNSNPPSYGVHGDGNYSNSSRHMGSSGPNPSDWNHTPHYMGNNYNNRQLLPPLRRPDPNQMPADVLGVLLKSDRFTEILGDRGRPGPGHYGPGAGGNFGAQPRMNASPRSYQAQGPGGYPPQHQQAPYTPPRQNQQSPNRQFVLSPAAKEFVPRSSPRGPSSYGSPSYQAPQSQQPQFGLGDVDPNMLAMAVAQVNFEQQQQHSSPNQVMNQPRYNKPSPSHSNDSNSQGSDTVLDSVTETIAYLTSNPGEFGVSTKKLIKLLNTAIPTNETGNEALITETLSVIITLIVEQSISQRNFSYTGARLCDLLREHKIGGKVDKGDLSIIQKLVLSRVQEIFSKALRDLSGENSNVDVSGVMYFLAELFTNFRSDTGPNVQFFGFGVAALELMQKLLKRGKPDDIKLVCNVLKLIGYDLDVHENPKLKTQMQEFMNDMTRMSVDSALSPDTKAIITRIVDLKKANWGREPSTSVSSNEDNVPQDTAYVPQGPEYFELPDSEDEDFDIEDEPDIVSQCFDEFLSGLPSKKK